VSTFFTGKIRCNCPIKYIFKELKRLAPNQSSVNNIFFIFSLSVGSLLQMFLQPEEIRIVA